jgi:tripartite-type tricarboxylate transporter receptor subunit TctC
LLLGQSGPISINPAVYKDLPYDPEKDFAPITMTTAYPYILVVNAKLPAKSLQDFVAMVRAKPGEFNYGTTGVGAANHLVTELFSSKAGLRMTHVPYRGTALAVTDLLAGQVTMVFADPVSALPHMQSGALRALAVTSKERSPIAPDVPTIAESGYPGFDAIAWHGILAPANTPPAIIAKLHDQIVAALKDPTTKSLLEAQAMQTVGDTPEHFAAFIKQDIGVWKAVAATANVSVK